MVQEKKEAVTVGSLVAAVAADSAGKYKCSVCGKLKRGHVCTGVAALRTHDKETGGADSEGTGGADLEEEAEEEEEEEEAEGEEEEEEIY